MNRTLQHELFARYQQLQVGYCITRSSALGGLYEGQV